MLSPGVGSQYHQGTGRGLSLMAALLRMQQPVALPGDDFLEGFEDPLTAIDARTAIEYALIATLLRSTGSQGDLHVWHNGNETVMMNLETGSAVVMTYCGKENHEIRDPG